MALWTAGILLLAGLAWFIGGVVVPFLQTRAVLKEARMRAGMSWGGDPVNMLSDEAIRRLGGPERAARKLGFYLRMPDSVAGDKSEAIRFLCDCGRPAISGLIEALDYYPGSNQWCGLTERCEAIRALGRIGPDASEALPHLLRRGGPESSAVAEALGNIGVADPEVVDYLIECLHAAPYDQDTCRVAAEALGKLGPVSAPAVPDLTELLRSEDAPARRAAVEALRSIAPKDSDAWLGLFGIVYGAEEEETLRLTAAQALARIGRVPGLTIVHQAEMLEDAVNESNGPVHDACAEALAKVRGEESPP